VRIAIAASGTPAGNAAEAAAFEYCIRNEIEELLVIHILETQLGKFGEIDPLADGSSKAEFITYIHERAHTKARLLHDRLFDRAAVCNIKLEWHQKEGDPFTEIVDITSAECATLLFIGQGTPPESFFSPPKNLATKLVKHCSCRVVMIAAGNSENYP
jgi:hypothetical protein